MWPAWSVQPSLRVFCSHSWDDTKTQALRGFADDGLRFRSGARFVSVRLRCRGAVGGCGCELGAFLFRYPSGTPVGPNRLFVRSACLSACLSEMPVCSKCACPSGAESFTRTVEKRFLWMQAVAVPWCRSGCGLGAFLFRHPSGTLVCPNRLFVRGIFCPRHLPVRLFVRDACLFEVRLSVRCGILHPDR